ncbi:MAG: RlmE family RNA methyltransferase [Gammaproteobacteria bacterium]|jgi:23S rRNA (uridine2552-2'-O)-methyltransferase
MAKRRSKTKEWVRRQAADPYVKQREAAGLRSRAAFKLKEILARDRLLKRGATVVDFGSSPGGWSQIASAAVGRSGKVVAVDLLPMDPLEGVEFIQGDARDPAILARVRDAVGELTVDLVISDIAPNITGIRDLDEANFLELAENVRSFVEQVLGANGALVIKLFQFPGTDDYIRDLKTIFGSIVRRKPDSSRKASREFYVVATGFRI